MHLESVGGMKPGGLEDGQGPIDAPQHRLGVVVVIVVVGGGVGFVVVAFGEKSLCNSFHVIIIAS